MQIRPGFARPGKPGLKPRPFWALIEAEVATSAEADTTNEGDNRRLLSTKIVRQEE